MCPASKSGWTIIKEACGNMSCPHHVARGSLGYWQGSKGWADTTAGQRTGNWQGDAVVGGKQ
jgi:hypothetical protein